MAFNPTQPNPPPFTASATIEPKQIIRWLDINPQGGQLQRCRFFISAEAFNITPANWTGISDIVGAYNFTSPNSFSILCVKSTTPKSTFVQFNTVTGISGSGTVIGGEGGGMVGGE